MLDEVVVAALIAESGLAHPQLATEVRKHDAGFLGDLAAGGVDQILTVVEAAAG